MCRYAYVRMRFVVAMLVYALIFSSCESKKEMPADFNFSCIPFDFDVYNSADSVYTREQQNGRDSSVKIIFSQEEKARVFRTMEENGFWEMPDKIKEKGPCVALGMSSFIEAIRDGQKKKVGISFDCSYENEEDASRFERIRGIIQDILRTKAAFRNVPAAGLLRL